MRPLPRDASLEHRRFVRIAVLPAVGSRTMSQNTKMLIGALIAAGLAIAVYYGLIGQQTANNIQGQANQTLGTTPASQRPAPTSPSPTPPATTAPPPTDPTVPPQQNTAPPAPH